MRVAAAAAQVQALCVLHMLACVLTMKAAPNRAAVDSVRSVQKKIEKIMIWPHAEPFCGSLVWSP